MSSQVAPTDKPRAVPDASDVANQFITQYYTLLHQDPSQLIRLYFDRSTLIFGLEGDAEATTAFGTAAIKQTIADAGFDNCKVCVSNYDGQLSASNGILIQVLGELSSNDGPWRRFSQTFFLVYEGGRYWVLNDMFRYLKSDAVQDEIAEEVDQAIDTEVAQAEHEGHLVKHDVDITDSINALQQPGNALPEAPAEPAALEAPQEPAAETPAAPEDNTETAPTEEMPEEEAQPKEAQEEPQPEAAESASKDAPATLEEVPVETPAAATDKSADAASEQPAAAPAAAPASKPAKPTSWANLAATHAGKWANQGPPATTKVVPAPRPAPQTNNKTASKPSTPTSGAATPTAPKPAAGKPAAAGGRVPGASVYVRNVDKIKMDVLKAAMAPFGHVLNVSMLPTGRAYVDFSSPEEARKAIAHSDQNQGVAVDLGSGQSHKVLVQTKNPSATPTLRGGRGGGNFARTGSQGGRRGGRGGAQAAR